MYLEDNEDGTCTMTINIPHLEIYEQSLVLELGADSMLEMVQAGVPQEMQQQMFDRMTIIPGSPEEGV